MTSDFERALEEFSQIASKWAYFTATRQIERDGEQAIILYVKDKDFASGLYKKDVPVTFHDFPVEVEPASNAMNLLTSLFRYSEN